MRKYLSRLISSIIITSFLVAVTPFTYTAASENTTSYLTGLSAGEKVIAEAVYLGFSKRVGTLKEEVAAYARPKLEEISKVVQVKMLANKSAIEKVTYSQPDISTIVSTIPPSSMLAMIPAETKAKAQAQAQEQVAAQIQQSFAEMPSKIETAIGESINSVSSDIVAEIQEMLKSLIFDIGDLIDTTINASIEAEIEEVIPTVMEELPEDMQDMSPEEIATKLQEKIQPAAEAALRPPLEAEIKAVISQLVAEIIEAPLADMMDARLIQVNTDACYGVISQMPADATAFVSEDFIRTTVAAQIASLNAALPAMITKQQMAMQDAVKKAINDFIDVQTKLYINGKMSTIKLRILNNQAFLAWNTTLKAIGAKSKYNSKTKTITVTKEATKVVFTLGSRTIKINDKTYKNELDKGDEPQLVSKMPMLPAEEVAELFGYECDYNQDWGMTTIGVAAATQE